MSRQKVEKLRAAHFAVGVRFSLSHNEITHRQATATREPQDNKNKRQSNSMSPSQSRQGHGYGSIAIENMPTSGIDAGVSRERARSFLFLSMIAGTAALLLTLLVAYHGQEDTEMSISKLLETQGGSKHNDGPDPEHWYKDQLVDHFGDDKNTWHHRYYDKKTHFGGPGHPIFLVLGGEVSTFVYGCFCELLVFCNEARQRGY